MGREVRAPYRGKSYHDTVTGTLSVEGKQRWMVRFEDGFSTRCSEKILREWLIPIDKEFVYKQIDYIFVSSRWRSSAINCKVKWGPSIRRNKMGPADHALIECTWKWRVRKLVKPAKTDFSALRTTPKPGGGLESAIVHNFSAEFNRSLLEEWESRAGGHMSTEDLLCAYTVQYIQYGRQR